MVKRAVLYARCSTTRDQKPEVQLEELRRYCNARGFEIVKEITDHGYSGSTSDRPGLKELLKLVRERQVDVVISIKLDRVFRSLKNMLNILSELDELGVEYIAVRDQFDLTTSVGRYLKNLILIFGEFELDLTKERTRLGLAHAISKGKKLGRPLKNDFDEIRKLRSEGLSYRKIAVQLNCSMGAVCRALRDASKNSQKIDGNMPVIQNVEKGAL